MVVEFAQIVKQLCLWYIQLRRTEDGETSWNVVVLSISGRIKNNNSLYLKYEVIIQRRLCLFSLVLENPSEKYERQIGNLPQIAVKIKNI